MKVLLDLDGVMADFTGGAIALHGKSNPYDDPANIGEHGYGMDKLWGMSPEEFWMPMGFDFWADLPKTKEADAVLEILTSEFGFSSVCFLTSPCRSPGCVEGKKAWVQRHYQDIPILFSVASCRPGAQPPKDFLAHEDSLLIDDNTANVENFWNAGGEAFLFPRPWNHRHAEEPVALKKLAYAIKRYY